MRAFLLVILVAVSGVLLWAIWSQLYVNTLIFTLGLIATGLCGYLIADYFFHIERKAWQSDSTLYKKEAAALKEELDILRKQASLATPQAEVDELRKRNQTIEAEKNKINGESLAQAATISSLNARNETVQKSYETLKEEATLTVESRATELEAIRDTLATTKLKITEIATENEQLKSALLQHKAQAEAAHETQQTLAAENEALKNELARYKADVTAITQTQQALTSENEALKNDLSRYKTEQAAITQTQQTLTSDNEALKNQLAHAKADIEAMALTYQTLSLENEDLKHQLSYSEGVTEAATPIAIAETEPSTSALSRQLELEETVGDSPMEMVDAVTENEALDNDVVLPTVEATPIELVTAETDDLTVIVGIESKIEALLFQQGITTWKALSQTSVDNLRDILQDAGVSDQVIDPTTWPEQARLLANGDMNNFKAYTFYILSKRNKAEVLEETTPVLDTVPEISDEQGVEGVSSIAFMNGDDDERIELYSHRSQSRSIETNGSLSVIASPISDDVETLDEEAIATDIALQDMPENNTAESAPNPIGHPIYGSPDDLKVIEGVGPKIESLLKEAGILTWHDVAAASVETLKGVLDKAGSRFRLNDPSTWPEQAQLLANEDWDKFKNFTNYLIGGKKPKE